MAKQEKHALYLVNPDSGRVVLIHADDVEDKQKAGYKQLTGQKANGSEWNHEDDLVAQDHAAEFAKAQAEADGKKAAEKSKELEAEVKAQEKLRADEAEKPDMKVQVVTPPKKK